MPVEHDRMTSSDVWLMNNSEEMIGLIDECSQAKPELLQISASPITKTQYKTLLQTALPTVGFRESNEGRVHDKTTLATAEVECKFLDASWSLDEKVALECEWGTEMAITLQAKAHLEAALQHTAIQTWYGTNADAKGFRGIASLLPYKNSPMVVDAGGTQIKNATSIYAIRTGLDAVQYAWGQNGRIADGEIKYAQFYDKEGRAIWGYMQPISGYVGLQVPTHQCIGRICNITEEIRGTTKLENFVSDLLELFPVGKEPTMLFMTKKARGLIRAERTATNPTGSEAPYPENIFGIPIFVSEAISNHEDILLAC